MWNEENERENESEEENEEERKEDGIKAEYEKRKRRINKKRKSEEDNWGDWEKERGGEGETKEVRESEP